MRPTLLVIAVFAAVASGSPLAGSAPPRPRDARPSLLSVQQYRSTLALRGGDTASAQPPPHTLAVRELLNQMDVLPEQGLSSTRAEQLLKLHGPNELEVEEADPLWKLFLAQFDDRLVQILLCVAALSYALAFIEGEANGWVEPAVILGILLLNAFVSRAPTAHAAHRSPPHAAACDLAACDRIPDAGIAPAAAVCPRSALTAPLARTPLVRRSAHGKSVRPSPLWTLFRSSSRPRHAASAMACGRTRWRRAIWCRAT